MIGGFGNKSNTGQNAKAKADASGDGAPKQGFGMSALGKLGTMLNRPLVKATQPKELPIGIDFGTGSLKILQLAPGEPPSLIAAACVETPNELLSNPIKRLEFQIDALPRLIRSVGFRGKRAVCAIPGSQTFCKQMQFARTDGIPLGDLIESAIPLQLGCEPSSLVYRHIEVGAGERKAGAEAIIVGARRELVDRLMRAVVDCRLEPVGIHSEMSAVLRAFDYIHKREVDKGKNTLYLDIGAGSTKVMISHYTELMFARVMDFGGRHLDELVSQQAAVTIERARQMRNEMDTAMVGFRAPVAVAAGDVGGAAMAGDTVASERRDASVGAGGVGGAGDLRAKGFNADVLSQPAAALSPEGCDLREPIEILSDELLMCMRYHAGQYPSRRVERAIFVGGEVRHRGVCQAIAKALRLPTQVADPLARVARTGNEPALGVDMKQPQPGWAVAMGLCLSPTDV